jgi:hypothetical protein
MNETCPKQVKHIFENCETWKYSSSAHERPYERPYNLSLIARSFSDFELIATMKGGISSDLQDYAYEELVFRLGKEYTDKIVFSDGEFPEWFRITEKEKEQLRKKVNYTMVWLLESWRYFRVNELRGLAKQLDKYNVSMPALSEAIIRRQLKYDHSQEW